MLLNGRNETKRKLASGQRTVGLFLLSCSSIVTELCATLPLDWVIVDLEASPASAHDVTQMFQALKGSDVSPMVRVRWHDHHLIEQALDLGAHAVLVPKVDDADTAARVASACRYPPAGRRGINPVRASGYFRDVPGYLRTANDETLCMVQIESREAVANAGAIAAVDGVDVIFMGMGDLASSYGQPAVVTGAAMDDARAAVLQAAASAGKVPGIFAYSCELATQYAKEGFRFIAIGNDLKILRQGIEETVRSSCA